MNFADALAAQLAGPEIPPDAFTVRDFQEAMKKKGREIKYNRAGHILRSLVSEGKYETADGIKNRKAVKFYWPVTKGKQ